MRINKLFYLFLSAHLIIWTLIPSITNRNLPLDVIEALAWGSNLDWGFNKHPPLSAFAVEIFYTIFGNQDWAYYFLSQIFVVSAFYFVFKLSKKILNNDRYALLSIFLLEGIFFYNFTTPEFNVNVCQLPFWAMTAYYAIQCLEKYKTKDCILLGIVAALGFLSKYLFIYLIISILIFYLINFDKYKFKKNYLIVAIVFIVILIPHLIWLVNNDYITIFYGLKRTGESKAFLDHFILPFIFLIKQIGILIPLVLMMIFLLKKIKIYFNFKNKHFLYLLSISILPVGLMFLTSMLMAFKIKTMWMTPFYLFFGTFLIYIFQKQIDLKKIKKFYVVFLFIFILSPLLYGYISLNYPFKRTSFDGKGLAKYAQSEWDKKFKTEIKFVRGENEWIAGNLSYHLKSRPKWERKFSKNYLNDKKKDELKIQGVILSNK